MTDEQHVLSQQALDYSFYSQAEEMNFGYVSVTYKFENINFQLMFSVGFTIQIWQTKLSRALFTNID